MELNCVTGIVKNAEQTASTLQANALEEMPLYGLPVSIKESMNIKVISRVSLIFFASLVLN